LAKKKKPSTNYLNERKKTAFAAVSGDDGNQKKEG